MQDYLAMESALRQPEEVPGYEHECPVCGDYFDKHEVHYCTKPPLAPEVK